MSSTAAGPTLRFLKYLSRQPFMLINTVRIHTLFVKSREETPEVVVCPPFIYTACVRWVGEIKYRLIAASRGAFTS